MSAYVSNHACYVPCAICSQAANPTVLTFTMNRLTPPKRGRHEKPRVVLSQEQVKRMLGGDE